MHGLEGEGICQSVLSLSGKTDTVAIVIEVFVAHSRMVEAKARSSGEIFGVVKECSEC